MPRRLLMAAEILLDVARTVNAADRPLLEAAADELVERAQMVSAAEGRSLDRSPGTAAHCPSIRRLAAVLEVDGLRALPVH